MKKKVVSALLCATMVATMFVGCGGNKDSKPADTSASDATPATEDAAEVADEGKVLNIYCWNEEFKSRITDHYPDYQEVDATHGKIGDVDVVWNITPNDDNAYQNNLDQTLLNQESAAADDKIDIFLVEADYALKYVDTDYTLPITDLGISEEDLSKQYQYTKDIVTDSNGTLKGVSWQGCPGVLFYNRDAAKEVLGTDDPVEVQNYVSDWPTRAGGRRSPSARNRTAAQFRAGARAAARSRCGRGHPEAASRAGTPAARPRGCAGAGESARESCPPWRGSSRRSRA